MEDTCQAAAACPYCKGALRPIDTKQCPSCQATFPWDRGIADLKRELQLELKERETGRIRATLTLVDEVFSHAKGGPPVTLAAIKGFVNAWLLPRVVVVVGSMLAALVLIVQTWILFQQTRLIDVQARAARFEQEVLTQARLRDIQEVQVRWQSMRGVLDRGVYEDLCREGCDQAAVRDQKRSTDIQMRLIAHQRMSRRILRLPQTESEQQTLKYGDEARNDARTCLLPANDVLPLVQSAHRYETYLLDARVLRKPLTLEEAHRNIATLESLYSQMGGETREVASPSPSYKELFDHAKVGEAPFLEAVKRLLGSCEQLWAFHTSNLARMRTDSGRGPLF